MQINVECDNENYQKIFHILKKHSDNIDWSEQTGKDNFNKYYTVTGVISDKDTLKDLNFTKQSDNDLSFVIAIILAKRTYDSCDKVKRIQLFKISHNEDNNLFDIYRGILVNGG